MSAQVLPVPPGLTVRFEHSRRVLVEAEAHLPDGPAVLNTVVIMREHEWKQARNEGFECTVLPGGGGTVATLYKGDEPVAAGRVRCNPEDNYVKAIGRVKALGEARRMLANAAPARAA